MRVRRLAVVLLVSAVLAACTPRESEPHPTGTLEPSITASSAEPTSHPVNESCKLLTAKERFDLVGMSMDAEAPVQPALGTQECIWVHTLNQPARAAIRIIAIQGSEWVKTAAGPLATAIAHPGTSKELGAKLTAAMREITTHRAELSDKRICEIYSLFNETRNMTKSDDAQFFGVIGSLPAMYTMSCEGGYVLMVGFGEYGLRPSFAVSHGVLRLAEAAVGRADQVYGGADDESDGSTSDDATSDDTSADESASPSPEPSSSSSATADSTDSTDDASDGA